MATNPGDREHDTSDHLLSRLEKELDEIEVREILQGCTPEQLEKMGFTGDGEIPLPRSRHEEITEKEKLRFTPEVEFERRPDTDTFEDLAIEDLLYLKDIEKSRLIATRNADEHAPFEAGNNVRREDGEGIESYYAEKKGKVLIIRDALHVFPSDIDARADVRLSDDRMTAYASCSPGYGGGAALTAELVMSKLRRIGVRYGIDEQAIEAVVDRVNGSGTPEEEAVVARGRAPVPGRKGRADFAFNLNKEEYGFKILPDGRIDYRNVENISTVEKGTVLARLVPPGEGVPGIDLFERSLAAPSGEPATLAAGAGVAVSDDGATFTATTGGQIVLNGSVLQVMNVYTVAGDVDYSAGNIDFRGNVIIRGGVLEGFEVHADGDIFVSKNVESATLNAGRDVVIRGGVLGKGKGLVAAGRDIHVEYAQNARLEAQGNIYIGNYAINSLLYTSKALKMHDKRGAVMGGEVYAQRGIDVRTLGSENGVKTYVEAGTDFLVLRKIAEFDDMIAFYEKNRRRIEDTLRVVAREMAGGKRLADARKSLVKKALEKKNELEQRMSVMQAKRFDLYEMSRERDVCFVKVFKSCYPDVYIKIRDQKTAVTVKRENVRFYEDRKAGEIGVGTY